MNMNPVLRISLFLGVIVYFAFILYFLRKKELNLKYTLLWIVSGVMMLIALAFPQAVAFFADQFGIASVANALFVMVVFFLLIILISITSIVSTQNEKNKRLIQRIALLEKRIRDLEKSLLQKGKP